MAIDVITFQEKKKWDDIVKSFSKYEVYELNGYVSGLKQHGDGEPLLIYIEQGVNRAINVVFKRDIANSENFKSCLEENQFFDLSTPYGYGGFIAEKDLTPEMMSEYESFCRESNWICEFVRFNPMLNNVQSCKNYYDTVFLGNTIYIDLQSEEYVWNNFSSKNRNMIRKAVKSGVEIKHTKDRWIIDDFMRLYNATMDRDNAEEYYFFGKSYYETFFNDLDGSQEFFYAVKNDEIIAASIMMFANNNMHYHLSASTMEGRRVAATSLLILEAAKYGISRGYKALHLGGGVGAKQDSLYNFKKAFNKGEEKDYHIGKKVFNKELYEKLTEMSGVSEDVSFFPKYRGRK